MKDLIFVIGLLFFIVIALKVLFWALTHVLTIVGVAALVYIVVRMAGSRKKNRANT
jgi:threonine/homoserine/homoserine lactone efflux protein